ncbi:MAG: hypothetical protein ACE5FZ_09215 [Nitrospiria bacterium]
MLDFVASDFFDYLLGLEAKRASRYSYPFSLLVIEVDRENVPGEVLDFVSGLIREHRRDTDPVSLARGGDRAEKAIFRLLCSHAGPVQIRLVGERIRRRSEIQTYRIGREEGVVTFSEGAACYPYHNTYPEELSRIAMEMAGKSREEGGNRFHIPPGPPPMNMGQGNAFG